MTRDVQERLEMYSGVNVDVQRVALNINQVRELNPPENPAKATDSRYEGYRQRFGDSSWELDAIEPAALASIVRGAIRMNRDASLWRKACAKQQEMRDDLERMADDYGTE